MKRLILSLLLLSTATIVFSQENPIDLDDNSKRMQVFTQDVIIQGSECVGLDCPSNQNFGFNTIILKENNLRIKFEDTSNTASFPSNDWILEANDSSNGGGNHFAIQDANTGRDVFKIEAGARTNALYVEDDGDIGIGTSTPAVDVDIKTGNTPTVRLQQDGTNGFTPQTWDLAGNETNFFIRDATNGSTLPFRIRPSAPTSSIDIEGTTGDVGFGTSSPVQPIHIVRSGANATGIRIDNTNTASPQPIIIRMVNFPSATEQQWNIRSNNDGAFELRNATLANSVYTVDPASNLTTFPGDVTVTGTFMNSDRRLKNSINPFSDGLNIVRQLRPVSFRFNETMKFNTNRTHYGVVAQELQEVAPYLVSPSALKTYDDEGYLQKSEDYLKIDDSAIKWLLVNAINDQQELLEEKEARIEDLEQKVDDLADIASKVDGLTQEIEQLKELLSLDETDVLLRGTSSAVLGQNYPNPYARETVIEYFLPVGITSAEINFHDQSGKLIKSVDLDDVGKGRLNLKVSDLPVGNYNYTLVVDGKVADTKTMAVTR